MLIMPQALGIVHIFVPASGPNTDCSNISGERMPIVLASPRVGEHVARHRHQHESAVEFTIGEHPGVGVYRPAELKRQSAVEIEPECLSSEFLGQTAA
jgi:hypothetical protein